jgi:sulfite reductase alpha subunit-like flavoprotein
MATLFILYGSATGNAEGIAKDLAEKPLPAHFSSVLCEPMEKFKKMSDKWSQPPSKGKKHGIVLISSTTGNGDAPENASRFVRYIKRKTTVDAQPFQHCAFSVLGLGDTNYDQFCAIGRMIDKRMPELGGLRAKELACADEATGLEDVVEPYMDSVLGNVEKACIAGEASCETLAEKKRNISSSVATPVPTTTLTRTTPAKETVIQAPAHVTAASPPPSKSESPLFILYGSATGNAEQIAKDLASTYENILSNPDSKTFFPSVVCYECNQFKKKCLPTWEQEPSSGTKHGVIIVASTTGNGESPENAGRFMRYLKRKQTVEAQPFQHCSFSVLGLGDTNYDQFCETGKNMDKKVAELGGNRAMPLACADEATGLEDVVEPWTDKVLLEITNACRGVCAPTTTTSSAITRKADSKEFEEEKKSESIAEQEQILLENLQASQGLRMIRSLLSLKPGMPMANVELSTLPALRGSRSSCELFKQGDFGQQHRSNRSASFDEGATISTSSSGSLHYSMNKPFEAQILGARYLTNTCIDGASRICEGLGSNGLVCDKIASQARDILDSHFPLSKCDSTVCEKNGKRVIEMSLSLPDDYTLEYQPGDALGLIVSNTPAAVNFVLDILRDNQGLSADQMVSIDSDQPITIEHAVKERIDLCCVVKNKRTLFGLAQFSNDPEEVAALHLMSSKTDEGDALFQKFIVNQRRSVVDILSEFPSCQNITMEGLLSILSPIAPRYYSICSSPLDQQRDGSLLSLKVAFSIVDYLTPSLLIDQEEHGLRRIQGVATGYLETLCSPLLSNFAGSTEIPSIKIFPKPTAEFRMPYNLSTPLILIGPGTGIAPFMGFLAHRRALVSFRESTDAANTIVEGTWRGGYELEAEDLPIGDKDASGLLVGADFRSQQKVGDVALFFGCRHSDHDWLYKEEIQAFQDEGIITNVYSAFSRDTSKKEYVQDIMQSYNDCGKNLVDLIMKQDASIYICGDGNHMARDVQTAIATLIAPHLVTDDSATTVTGKDYIEGMKQKSKFVLDIWS